MVYEMKQRTWTVVLGIVSVTGIFIGVGAARTRLMDKGRTVRVWRMCILEVMMGVVV
jgi:hypothetical protein